MQLDEKWSYVYKKQKHCDLEDPADHTSGDCWDHVAYDPESRLVLKVIAGKRSSNNVMKVVRHAKSQLQGRTPSLITSDNYGPYAKVIELTFSNPPRPIPSGQGKKRPPDPPRLPVNFATVSKTIEKGRVVEIKPQIVLGTKKSVAAALKRSKVSSKVNTSFLERYNATDRHRNARKKRRTYCFSKDWDIHRAVGAFIHYSYNFCWPVRTLRIRNDDKCQERTPAMAAGLADHVWTMREWLALPAGRPSS